MGSVVEEFGTGRVKTAGARDVFQGGGSVGSSIWIRDMGYDQPHGTGTDGFPEQGG